MDRFATRLVFASFILGACSSSSGPIEGGDGEFAMEERLVGGWDGASTTSTSVMLIRDGLSGSVSTTHLFATEEEYQLSFSVTGDIDEDDEELVILDLSCAEARTRSLRDLEEDEDDADDPMIPGASDEDPTGGTELEADGWDALDCAGWGLQLECSLAGACDGSDCDLFCDVIYFGDAFATAAIELSSIEDELDHWQRV